jgi:hypothetical protein
LIPFPVSVGYFPFPFPSAVSAVPGILGCWLWVGVDSQGVGEVRGRVCVDLWLLGWSGEGGWGDDGDRRLGKACEYFTQLSEFRRS